MRLAPLVLVVVCALVLFPGWDRVDWMDWREARDRQVAGELVERRELLTPLLGREAHFEKPIAAYAPEVALRLLARESPAPARALKAWLAVGLVLLTASIAARHLGGGAAWAAGLVLATSLGLPLAARTDGTQLLATLFGWTALAAFADALNGPARGRAAQLVVGWGAIAGALVVAGPLPALWPLGGVALYLGLARRAGDAGRLRPVAGLAIVAGLALPWYGAMIERHGAEFLARVAFFPYAVETRGAWYAGPFLALSFLIVGAFPWIALLPAALEHAATRWLRRRRAGGDVAGIEDPADARERREENAAHFFIACLFAALVPVAIYPGPPIPAALPALPAVALLCGRLLGHLLEDAGRLAKPVFRATLMLAFVGTVMGAMFALVGTRARDVASELRLVGTVVFATSWAPLLAALLGRARLAAALVLLPVALGAPVVTLRLLPAMSGYFGTGDVARVMNAASPPRAPLVLLEPPPPSLRLHAARTLVVADDPAAALARWRAADGLAYVAFRPRREGDVARAARGPLEILVRTPSLVLARVHPG